MKVLVADDSRGHRSSLRRLLERETDVQVSGIAEDAEIAPDSVIARELRSTLDGCPICDAGYRDHAYAVLAQVVIGKDWPNSPRLKQYFGLLHAHRWSDLFSIQEWNEAADCVVGFAFRCTAGRVGIVTMLCPAKPDSPDTPLHYMILRAEEGNSLLAFFPPEKWLPMRSVSCPAR